MVSSDIRMRFIGEGINTLNSQIKQTNTLLKQQMAMQAQTMRHMGVFNKTTNTATTSQAGFGKQLFGTGLALMAVHKGIAFVIDELKRGVKEFREFETRIAEINTLLGEQGDEILPAMADSIQDMATKYGQSISDLSKGLYDIISAAFEAKDAIYLLDQATKASIAGLTDVRTATDTFTTVLNAYGYSAYRAAEVSDILFQSVVRGKFQFAELASALGYVVPIAAQAGISLEELAAALSTTTRHGLHLDMTARGLALMIQGFVNPTKAASEAADEYGIRMDAVYLKSRGLVGMMEQLTQASKEYGSAILPDLVKNMRSLRVAMVLASEQGFTGMIDDMDLLEQATGRTNEALEKMMATQEREAAKMEEQRKRVERQWGEGTGAAAIAVQGGLIMMAQSLRMIVDKKGGIEGLKDLFGETGDEVERNNDIYAAWQGLLDKNSESLQEQQDIVITLKNAIKDYKEELEDVTGYTYQNGEAIKGTLYLQKERLLADKELSDIQHEVSQGLLQEGYNYKSLSVEGQKAIKFLREYKNQEDENRIAMKRYTLAMQENNLEIMKLQLRGMQRRRGLSRSEERQMKQLRIQNLEEKIAVEETNKAVTVSDYDRYIEAQRIIDLEVNAAKERVYEINYTYDIELQALEETIKRKIEYYASDEEALKVHMANMRAIRENNLNVLQNILNTPSVMDAFEQNNVSYSTIANMYRRERVTSRNPYSSRFFNMAGSLGFQSGTYRVPQTGMAMVHEGESITPKGGRSRGGGAGGGNIHVDPMHINVNVYDHTGVEQLVQKIELAIQSGLVTGITTGYS